MRPTDMSEFRFNKELKEIRSKQRRFGRAALIGFGFSSAIELGLNAAHKLNSFWLQPIAAIPVLATVTMSGMYLVARAEGNTLIESYDQQHPDAKVLDFPIREAHNNGHD